jgi:hypothetical protein
MPERDYSNSPSNLYDKEGIIKNPLQNPLKHKYTLDYHLRKTKNEILKKRITDFIKNVKTDNQIKIQYSKCKISLVTRYIFLFMHIRRNFVYLNYKENDKWLRLTVNNKNMNIFSSIAKKVDCIKKQGYNCIIKNKAISFK